jgi:hypothetical protein
MAVCMRANASAWGFSRATTRAMSTNAAKYPVYAATSQYDALNSQHFHYQAGSTVRPRMPSPIHPDHQISRVPAPTTAHIPNENVWRHGTQTSSKRRSRFGLYTDAHGAFLA